VADKRKLEIAVIKTALRRYRAWATAWPKCNAEILAGSDNVGGGKLAADMIRACAALAKARKK
jgi:hypothetical protein